MTDPVESGVETTMRPLRDTLSHLAPAPDLAAAVLDTAAAMAAAPPRAREAAAVPFLRLMGLAGPLAPRYAALAGFHAAEAPARAALLAARCHRADIDPAFDAAFADH